MKKVLFEDPAIICNLSTPRRICAHSPLYTVKFSERMILLFDLAKCTFVTTLLATHMHLYVSRATITPSRDPCVCVSDGGDHGQVDTANSTNTFSYNTHFQSVLVASKSNRTYSIQQFATYSNSHTISRAIAYKLGASKDRDAPDATDRDIRARGDG